MASTGPHRSAGNSIAIVRCAALAQGEPAMHLRSLPLLVGLALAVLSTDMHAQRALAPADVDDIARLLMLEDRRQLDDTSLARILRSAHPEVRRRAALAVGRIANARGRPLLIAARGDADTAVFAAVVLGTGQLADTSAVSWLASVMTASRTEAGIATE